MKEMYETLMVIYGKHFLKTNDYSIIRFKVVATILSYFYRIFVDSKEIIPLEELAPDIKKRLWNIAGQYHTDKELRLIASKAAYVLEVSSLNN